VTKPVLIDRPNISLAWAEAFSMISSAPARRLAPLTLSFEGFANDDIAENAAIRSALEASLSASEMQKVQTVASTIFPQALWRVAKGDRQALYSAYRDNLAEYVAMESSKNRRGLYFGRLIAYDIDPKTGERLPYVPDGTVPQNGNQLEFVIRRCKKGVRASAYQLSLFDPSRDHLESPYLPFPCLQHVTFVPDFNDGTLGLNAFYATQQLFEKGYGNYLGLAQLGMFIASQTGLKLSRVSCFVGI
jgi:thymidylate synthase